MNTFFSVHNEIIKHFLHTKFFISDRHILALKVSFLLRRCIMANIYSQTNIISSEKKTFFNFNFSANCSLN